MVKVGTSNPDRTISLKRLQCLVENKHKPPDDELVCSKHVNISINETNKEKMCILLVLFTYLLRLFELPV